MPRPKKPVEYLGPVPVDLAEIDDGVRPASQMRARLDAEAIREYAGILAEMPPVKLMWDGKLGKYWVVDGAHTLTAFAGTGQQTVPAMIADGDWLMAFEAAAAENLKRGVPIREDDRKARVRNACEALHAIHDFRVKPWADKRLADLCGVSPLLAGKVLDDFLDELGAAPDLRRERSDGKLIPPSNGARGGDPSLDIKQHLESPTPGDTINGRPAPPRPGPYEGMRACLDEIQVLVASVNAPDDDVQRGWGGFAAVFSQMSGWERKSVRASLGYLIESLQEWELLTGVRDGPDRGEQA